MRERALALLLVASCSLAPTYERPASPIGDSGAAAASRNEELGWRQVFTDPRLQSLIGQALANNRDLRIATLNVELVRAQYRIARSEQFPTVGASAAVDLSGTKDDASVLYRAGVGVTSYELDLFGRVRNAKAQALEEYLATESAQRAAHLALVAEVATQYLRVVAFEEQQKIAARALETRQQFADITARLVEAGQRSDLEVRTAEALVHASRAEIARLAREKGQADHALAVLVGRALPADLPAGLALDAQGIVADVPAGVSSSVLLRRPDVLAAEHTLKGANYNIGIARAAFLPTISLTGLAGFASTALANLFTAGAFGWSFTPQLSVPLFTGGRNTANLDAAKVRKRIEVARYEKAIQVAFREVADALLARQSFETQLEAQTARATAEQKRYEISEARYKSGIESYLSVLIAQQDLYATQQQLVELRFARLANLAELYRALGGGWRER
ncbi:MAG TPA: efflux transporter outer membrane subunit [Kofleriaceae bacterium]